MQLIQTVLIIYAAVNLHICMSRGEEECWALVYKIATGGNGSAYDLFMSNDSLNVNDKEAMSLQCSKYQVKKHFKSDIVNNWSNVEIDLVRISLFVSGIEKAFFLFNGSETNKTSWFDKSRLINSSYSDLNKDIDFTHFSVVGIHGKADRHAGNYSRRFYIRNDKSDKCETDEGLLLVGDAEGNCQYEENITEQPFILFSASSNVSKAIHHAVADSMAIFIKFPIKATCFNQFAMNCVHENSPCITNSVQTSSTKTIPIEDQSQSTLSTSKDKDQSTTMRSEDLQNKINRIKMELTVEKKSTQKYMRSLTSAPDERTSSKVMGIIGGAFIISVIGLIMLLDCTTCNRDRKFKQKKSTT
ncbi:uncharacterized protein LOC127719654 [Mytilus californianus]|uniref:uncharacterized protein LOC127719654 n=1 Tax=Mytilus californianus TaxID=6549 RepID=UPI002246620C|nr:uncharacterized protein LOC127719654 [Mytilus californianus]